MTLLFNTNDIRKFLSTFSIEVIVEIHEIAGQLIQDFNAVSEDQYYDELAAIESERNFGSFDYPV